MRRPPSRGLTKLLILKIGIHFDKVIPRENFFSHARRLIHNPVSSFSGAKVRDAQNRGLTHVRPYIKDKVP
jgi:hypothetical protein